MRPKKLIMSAFGPYAGREEIDFEKLGESGIYLVTGDTGAGKTTIFDAITYALYGKANSKDRAVSMLRSKYAKPETPTEVELTFSYAGKEYTINRNPEYERPKKSGKGFTKENSSAKLRYPDGRTVSKENEVKAAITDIIGIDRDQFMQIAMIAQGDFLKLLTASTDDRQKIFRQIFKTDNYLKLQKQLKTETDNLQDQCDDIQKSIEQYVNGISCSEDDVLSLQVQKAKDRTMPLDEILSLLSELIRKDNEYEGNLKQEENELEEQLDAVKRNLDTAERIKQVKEDLDKAKAELTEAKQKEAELIEAFNAEENRKTETDEIANKIAKIAAEHADYDELDEKTEIALELGKELEQKNTKLEAARKKHVELKAQIAKLQEEAESLKNVGADKATTKAEIDKLKETEKKISELEKDINELGRLKTELEETQKDYRQKSEKASDAKKKYDTMHKAYLDEQAGILAETLAEGVACPVCGSTSHPKLAVKSATAPSKQEIEMAKNTAKDTEDVATKASIKSGEVNGQYTEKAAAVRKSKSEILGDVDLESKKTEISEQLAAAKGKLKKIEDDEKRKKENESELKEATKLFEENNNEISDLEKTILANEGRKKEIDVRVLSLQGSLMFESKEKAESEKNKLQTKKNELEKALEAARTALSEQKEKTAEIRAKIEENEKQLASTSEINAEEECTKKKDLENRRSDIEAKEKTVHARKKQNESALENIKGQVDDSISAEKKLSLVKVLSETANGSLTGKERIMLESYIQMTYFDRIIEKANSRFMIMSDGQYELKRKETADDNRSKSGLDLDVIDHYNGSERDVKSLSGGESFKASLSLALGLADEIQSSAGGIKLDTMFVDEGFGSLDDESLSQAMRALSSLAEGNRLVGIISHVNELKDRIDKQIVVKKDKVGGSHAEIVV